MPLLQQYGIMRILRLVIAVVIMLLLLVSFSRGGETVGASNQATETQCTFQSSSDHSKHPASSIVPQSVMIGEYQTVAHDHRDYTDSQPAGTNTEERSVLPLDSEKVGVDEHIGANISSPIYFTDSTGKQVDIRSLMDVPVLIVPVYYACTSVCHIFLSAISGVLPDVRLTPDKDYRILNVSLDASETPELAARKKKVYLKTVHQRDPSFPSDAWVFLTGSKQSIDTLMNEIGFYHRQVGKEYEHPIVVVSVSPEGKIIRYLYGVNLTPFDVTMALMEGDTSTPMLSAKRIARTCYSYDSKKNKYVVDSILVTEVMLVVLILILGLYLLLGSRK